MVINEGTAGIAVNQADDIPTLWPGNPVRAMRETNGELNGLGGRICQNRVVWEGLSKEGHLDPQC